MEGEKSAAHATPSSIAKTDADIWILLVSPDGHFAAYVSNESGRAEVSIRPFPTGEANGRLLATAQASRAGAATAKNYIVLAPGKRHASLMAVRITLGTRTIVSAPETLFEYLYKGSPLN